MSIIRDIRDLKKDDTHLTRLFDKVQEYAELYLIAKQRQKGCDGMGEVATLKDEFIYSLNKLIQHCKEKGYLRDNFSYDSDSIARDIFEI
ncbi:MAG: hypothetical protein WA126_03525 [Thermodesulfovibrionales bacterium]